LRPRGEAPGTSQRGAAVDAATQQLQLLGAAEAALEQRPSHAEGVETAVGRTTWKEGKIKIHILIIYIYISVDICRYIILDRMINNS